MHPPAVAVHHRGVNVGFLS
ncbi:hypothetical protein Prudu_618S000100 [Prunus dulcis]|uniref:Uncharacterized protein n=1 Tax=Prunus dulcis TaxID=3755 RepID=A0A5H2XPB4_PRUDU|nr:hypothetical protein Prudu_67S000200 [Prunus dulcis]BBN68872.1 hypothetical protein Prudu_618S000100 [Prunus dulcis]